MLLILVIAVAFFARYIIWSFGVNTYCNKIALAKLGENNMATLVKPNEDEKIFMGSKNDDDRISLGFREQLRCEHDPNVLNKFNMFGKYQGVDQNQKTITANWKTYTNNHYGFRINYPSGWKLSTDNYINDKKDYLLFLIYENTNAATRLKLYKDFIGGYCDSPGNVKKSSVELGNGIKGKKIECASAIAIKFQIKGDNLWLIATYVNDKNRDLFNQMLASFEFL